MLESSCSNPRYILVGDHTTRRAVDLSDLATGLVGRIYAVRETNRCSRDLTPRLSFARLHMRANPPLSWARLHPSRTGLPTSFRVTPTSSGHLASAIKPLSSPERARARNSSQDRSRPHFYRRALRAAVDGHSKIAWAADQCARMNIAVPEDAIRHLGQLHFHGLYRDLALTPIERDMVRQGTAFATLLAYRIVVKSIERELLAASRSAATVRPTSTP